MRFPLFTSSSSGHGSKTEFSIKVAILVGLLCLGQFVVAARGDVDGLMLSGGHMNILNFSEEEKRPVTLRTLDTLVESKPDVLYMVASTAYPMPPDKKDRRFTSEMVQELLLDVRVESLRAGAVNLEAYSLALRYFDSRDYRPTIAIVALNPRSFSPTWYKNPWFQFVLFKVYLKYDSRLMRAFQKPMSVFKTLNLGPVTQSTR